MINLKMHSDNPLPAATMLEIFKHVIAQTRTTDIAEQFGVSFMQVCSVSMTVAGVLTSFAMEKASRVNYFGISVEAFNKSIHYTIADIVNYHDLWIGIMRNSQDELLERIEAAISEHS